MNMAENNAYPGNDKTINPEGPQAMAGQGGATSPNPYLGNTPAQSAAAGRPRKDRHKMDKLYRLARGWVVVLVLALLALAMTALCAITKSTLYTNLTPYVAVYDVAFGVVVALHILLNLGRIPDWGFILGPAVGSVVLGAVVLAFSKTAPSYFTFIVAYSLLADGLVIMSHAFTIKGLVIRCWIPAMVAGLASLVPPILLIFYPYHGWLTVLTWSLIGFAVTAAALAVDALCWLLTQKREKKITARLTAIQRPAAPAASASATAPASVISAASASATAPASAAPAASAPGTASVTPVASASGTASAIPAGPAHKVTMVKGGKAGEE